MKRVLTLLLVLALVFSFVACTKSEQEPKGSETTKVTTGTTKGAGNTTAGTTTAEVEENPFEEFFEITWLTQLNADWRDGRWDELELEEMFNVDLKYGRRRRKKYRRMAALIAAAIFPTTSLLRSSRNPYGLFEGNYPFHYPPANEGRVPAMLKLWKIPVSSHTICS